MLWGFSTCYTYITYWPFLNILVVGVCCYCYIITTIFGCLTSELLALCHRNFMPFELLDETKPTFLFRNQKQNNLSRPTPSSGANSWLDGLGKWRQKDSKFKTHLGNFYPCLGIKEGFQRAGDVVQFWITPGLDFPVLQKRKKKRNFLTTLSQEVVTQINSFCWQSENCVCLLWTE